MDLEELSLLVQALLTLVGFFLAGRSWGSSSRVRRERRLAGLAFAAAEAFVLALVLARHSDLLFRSFYWLFGLAVVSTVLAGSSLVLAASPGTRKSAWRLVVSLGIVGLVACLWPLATRQVLWPPFAYLSLCLLLAPGRALASRLRVRGYQPFRDPEFPTWIFLGLCGLWGCFEAVTLVGVVPHLRGPLPVNHLFVAGTLILGLWLPAGQPPVVEPAVAGPPPVLWHLFNPPLTPREADLVAGLGRRLTNKELGAELGLSESTVKKHLVNVFRKAGVAGRRELIERLSSPS